MKIFSLTLLAFCALFSFGCAHHDNDQNHGHVGDGMGGQTVGSSFPRHMGAGHDDNGATQHNHH